MRNRRVFCGMLKALDEGVGNITATLAAAGVAENTLIGLTTDNGGQNGVGGNNWPLRGNKASPQRAHRKLSTAAFRDLFHAFLCLQINGQHC